MQINLPSSAPPPSPPPLITNLTSEQSAAITALLTTTSHISITAPAGSGKTYLLEALLCAINNHFPTARSAYVAFSSKLAPEFSARASRRGILNYSSSTAHKYGKTAIETHLSRTVTPDKHKLSNIIKSYPARLTYPEQETLARLVTLGKDSGIGLPHLPNTTSSWSTLFDHHSLDEPSSVPLHRFLSFAENILHLSNNSPTYDLSDLIYLPLLRNLPIPTYDFVLLDEDQDTNSTRLELVSRMLHPTRGRLISVGDPPQSIFGFNGADTHSHTNIASRFNSIPVNLTISQRCAQSITAHARLVFPNHIYSRPDAPEGSVTELTYPAFTQRLRVEDHSKNAVLCRKNAPLIRLAVNCIKEGIACRVEGKDEGTKLKRIIWKLKAANLPDLKSKLQNYRAERAQELPQRKFQKLDDTLQCVFALIELNPATVKKLEELIDNLFSDYNPAEPKVLTFSTVHKSKGLEWPTVFLLGRNLWMPSPMAQQPWELEQEKNLIYVAITRAMLHLVEVTVEE